jgi:antitoxin component of MazEF toxin-antitoxin module
MLQAKTTVSMWGNSQALRIPVEISRHLGILANDEVISEAKDNILTISKPSTPRKGTIEYLFKDYSGECFKSELTNPIEPVGREEW